MQKLAEICVRRPVFATMLILSLTVVGLFSYNSVGVDPSFYRPRRKYWEVGLLRRATIDGAVTFDGELRFHRIDNLKSIALGRSRWEYSYRLLVRAPFDLVLKR